MRWDPYVLADAGRFESFWTEHLATRQRNLLYVLGRGFDPRALAALKQLVALDCQPTVWLMAFDNGLPDSERRRTLTEANYEGLVALVGVSSIHELPISIGGSAFTNATSRNTRRAIEGCGSLSAYDDIVVDISAMPRMVAMTCVAKLLFDLDRGHHEGGRNTNLHVVAAESVSTDMRSHGSLMDQVTTVVGFSGHLSEQTTEHVPRVWFPVLGEGQEDRLQRIQGALDPDEICPVIPFPSRNPRRGDDLIAEHRVILFEDFQIEPANILRASEYNPFEAYRQLFGAMDRYRRALEGLGGCKAFVSPLSSKLLSIGALLACYDHRYGDVNGARVMVGIPYVETAAYGDPEFDEDVEFDLYSMWIRGEWET